MSLKFSSGEYNIKNPEKYLGLGKPKWRSSWEWTVMRMCDENPAICQWASESIKIPYRDPLTGKQTVYVPDFLVVFVDKRNVKRAELWEIKPEKQALKEKIGKNQYDQAQYVKNMFKWQMAMAFCKQHNMTFRVITERELWGNSLGSNR